MDNNRIKGAILALALGDAYGAPYEGGVLARLLWLILGKNQGKCRYTDDTQMTINIIESLLVHKAVNQDDLAERFAYAYSFSRGYGPGVSKVLKLIREGQPWQKANQAIFREGSYGNGGAMRSPAVGLFYANKSEDELCEAAYRVAVITHSHPLGIEGAILIALATALSYKRFEPDVILERLLLRAQTQEFADKINHAKHLLGRTEPVKPKIIARTLGNGIAAVDSCITAVYIALRFKENCFEELLAFAISVGGDVDTIAAMAGAIWGACRGHQGLPPARLEMLEDFEKLDTLSEQLSELIVI